MKIERRKVSVAFPSAPRRAAFALAATVLASAALAASTRAAQPTAKTPMPRYVSLKTADTLRRLRGTALPVLAPLENGKPLPASMPSLPGARAQSMDAAVRKIARLTNNPIGVPPARPERFAQAFPRPIPPARLRRATVTTPRWVRYPLEFQLCGIGIGTRAVDKDRFNRIDRYGLFAMHGNPTAVVVSEPPAATGGGLGGAGGGLGGAGGGLMGAGMPGGGAPGMGMPGAGAPTMGAPGGLGGLGTTTTTTTSSVTVQQTPPIAGAGLFPGGANDSLPDWASAITVPIDDNHVEWLYKRENYAMGFVVDRLGYVDAIVVAGTESPIARTQLEDPVHTVKLGDDLRKVMFRYGYPDTIETYAQNISAGATSTGGGSLAGPPTGGGNAGTNNNAYRTFELRYEQSYNVVFTIRNNRVARIYIFGDPDFFNELRRRQFRVAY